MAITWTKRRRIDPAKADDRSWYQAARIPPAATWPECSGCGVRARILDEANKECIKCRVTRAKQARIAGGPF